MPIFIHLPLSIFMIGTVGGLRLIDFSSFFHLLEINNYFTTKTIADFQDSLASDTSTVIPDHINAVRPSTNLRNQLVGKIEWSVNIIPC